LIAKALDKEVKAQLNSAAEAQFREDWEGLPIQI
jgi:hypothetical protein